MFCSIQSSPVYLNGFMFNNNYLIYFSILSSSKFPKFLIFLHNIGAIHMTLYRVYSIQYTWLFVNAQFYAVLCISHFKCIFLAFKEFDSPKPTIILKNM